MNKKLSPLLLLILGLICMYLGRVTDGVIGIGLSVGGLICLIAAIIGGIKKLQNRRSQQQSASNGSLMDYSATALLKSMKQSQALAIDYRLPDDKQHDLVNQLIAFYLLLLGIEFASSKISAQTSREVIESVIEYIARIVHKQGKRTGVLKGTEAEMHNHMRKEILGIISKYSSMPVSGSTEPGSLLWEYGVMIAETVDTTTPTTLRKCIKFVTSLETIDTKELVNSLATNEKHKSSRPIISNKLVTGLVILGLLFGSYHFYQYNRAPNEQDRLAFIYGCDEYLANEVFKSEDRDSAKATCSCLWPDLVGRYQTIGKINEKSRDNGKVSIGDSDVNAMALTCLKDHQSRN